MISQIMLKIGWAFDLNDPYILIIAACSVVILSYWYNIIASRTNIPSVLMLIITGMLISIVLNQLGFGEINVQSQLEILGIVGLIMIVLEAALDLELSKDKLPMIGTSLLVALICLLVSTFAIAGIIVGFIDITYSIAMLYATPLAIMSSAIIIPSVAGLVHEKKEFMVYEGAFSDILGIMLFYFIESFVQSGGGVATIEFARGLILTIIVAFLATYLLVFLFKDIKGHIRLFLLIAVLLFLYALGKKLHLSPLLIILVFGLALSNHEMFFSVFRSYFQNPETDPIEKIEKEFHLITLETSFVIRTFFFVVFGMSISLASLVGFDVFLISMLILLALYVVRLIVLKLFLKPSIFPELWIAPRGLITILLFYAISEDLAVPEFDKGILLYVIIISSIVMSVALISDKQNRGKPVPENEITEKNVEEE